MTVNEQKEHLQFCINRFDHFFDSVNNKSAVFLGVSTFIVAGLLALYPTIQQMFDCGFWINLVFVAMVLLGLLSVLATLAAGIPFLSKPGASILYYSSIASQEDGQFHSKLHSASSDDLVKDYADQVYQLSGGLRRKFVWLRLAGYIIFIQFLIAIPFSTLLINNFKAQ